VRSRQVASGEPQDKTEPVIHNQDGTISERNSYGTLQRPGPASLDRKEKRCSSTSSS
jgi:hypothetical protein